MKLFLAALLPFLATTLFAAHACHTRMSAINGK